MGRGIGFVGLGLIGGSMAKATRKAMDLGLLPEFDRIYALDTNEEVISTAIAEGIVDGSLSGSYSKCGLIMVALPPRALIRWAEENAHRLEGCILVDLCGIKTKIYSAIHPLAEAYGFTYVGGHPMAGREVSGYANSSAELFKGASMILTPDELVPEKTVKLLSELYLSLGFGRITLSTNSEHDSVIAYTSQLAHIASNAYIKSDSALKYKGFSAGSFKDLTRVAKLDEFMWSELFLMNRAPLIDELELYIENLQQYLEALKEYDSDGLVTALARGRRLKEAQLAMEEENI